MAIHLHRAERTDRLAHALGELLAQPPEDPFTPDLVAVPTPGIERFLTQTLGRRLGTSAGPGRTDGVCANVLFPVTRGPRRRGPRRCTLRPDPGRRGPLAARPQRLAPAGNDRRVSGRAVVPPPGPASRPRRRAGGRLGPVDPAVRHRLSAGGAVPGVRQPAATGHPRMGCRCRHRRRRFTGRSRPGLAAHALAAAARSHRQSQPGGTPRGRLPGGAGRPGSDRSARPAVRLRPQPAARRPGARPGRSRRRPGGAPVAGRPESRAVAAAGGWESQCAASARRVGGPGRAPSAAFAGPRRP